MTLNSSEKCLTEALQREMSVDVPKATNESSEACAALGCRFVAAEI